MQLLNSWKRSLDFFERKNLSMFGLVTLKSIKTTYSQLFAYFWVPIVFFGIYLFLYIGSEDGNAIIWQLHMRSIVSITIYIVFVLFVYLSVRPSTLRKDWRYYKSYWRHVLYLLGFFWLLVSLRLGVCVGVWGEGFVMLFAAFTTFFFLDARAGINSFFASVFRALKMILYNAPVCMITVIALRGAGFLYLKAAWFLSMIVVLLIPPDMFVSFTEASYTQAYWLFFPAVAALLANLYIKWSHEQFDLYYNQPK